MLEHWVNEELEKSCIGSALMFGLNAFVIMSATINSDDFATRICKHAWNAMRVLSEENLEIEGHSLGEEFRQRGFKEYVAMTAEIESMQIYGAGTLQGAITQATKLAKLARAQRVIRACVKSFNQAKLTHNSNPETICEFIQTEVTRALQSGQTQIEVKSSEDLAEIEPEQTTEELPGLTTGLAELDQLSDGLRGEQLWIIAGRPSMGKTAYAINQACVSSDQNKNVLFFSLEMPYRELQERLLVRYSGLGASQIRRRLMTTEQKDQYLFAREKIRKQSIFWTEKKDLNVHEIRSIAMQQSLQRKIHLIVIDYLQIIEIPANDRTERHDKDLGRVAKILKLIARELKCPVIALSQLNRDVGKRPDKRPLMDDLRESGELEQDADTIALMYRESYYNPAFKHKEELEIILGKQRSGQTGTARVGFNPATGNFYNLHALNNEQKRSG